ncbi:hypothetical protein BD769DRAFT_1672651 [Suillus cothurnatus]|nr:hypothetical protein BD769DRAFT_1672651 [Suillus cothurnatus]
MLPQEEESLFTTSLHPPMILLQEEQRTLKKSLDKAHRHLDKKKRRKMHHEELMDVRDGTPANDMQVDYDNVARPSGLSPHHSPPLPEPLPHSPAPAVWSACSGRAICMPNRYIDYLPGSVTYLEHMPPTRQQACGHHLAQADEPVAEPEAPQIEDNNDAHPLLIPSETEPDSMGLYCIYCTHPTLISKGRGALDSICDAPTLDAADNPAEQASQSMMPSVVQPRVL